MGTYKAAVVTEGGQNIIAEALAENKSIMFTSAKTSSYIYPLGTNIVALTGLRDVVQSVIPSNPQVINKNVAQISARFDNDGITQQYQIQTIGLYAQIEGGEEILFSVTQAITPDEMPVQSSVSPSAFIYNIQLAVQNAAQISVTVNPAGTATVADILAITNPEFDDSGVVDSIKSFPDFLKTFKSKMNFFRFLRDMKAGSQFVLHTGSIVNNCTSEAENLPLSAKQGKVLMDLYTQLYSDIDSQMVTTNFNDFLELSNDISVENVILVKRSKLIYISMEIYKTDNSSFSSARSTIGILKSGFTPQFKVYLTIPGETKRGSLVNTSGSIYIIKDGTIYIDRSNTDDPATCFSVMLSYFSS